MLISFLIRGPDDGDGWCAGGGSGSVLPLPVVSMCVHVDSSSGGPPMPPDAWTGCRCASRFDPLEGRGPHDEAILPPLPTYLV